MVADNVGLDASTVDYHLRRMGRASRVTREPSGREVAWFNVGCGLCPLLRGALPAFRRAGVSAVADALEETPMTMRAVAARAGLDVGEARWAFEVLRTLGVAERTATGKPQLAPGAAVCVAKARAGEACGRWGACAPSRNNPQRKVMQATAPLRPPRRRGGT
jgi:hypothetical protein